MDTVRIRQATLTDLPLLVNYRAMAAEMDNADEVALNRMITALEPYLRSAIPEDRWHSWIAEPGGCGSVEIVQWVPGRLDPTPRRAWIHSLYVAPPFRVVVLDAVSHKPSFDGVANADSIGSICTRAIKAGVCMNHLAS